MYICEMTKTGLVYSERFLEHYAGDAHPERPDRISIIYENLRLNRIIEKVKIIEPEPVPLDLLRKIHNDDYIERVRESCQNEKRFLDSLDTGINKFSYQVALLAAGGVCKAIDEIMKGRVSNAFCAVRPPGHHAESDKAMGFCIFNNIAVGAKYLIENYHLKRVMIIDWDVHHGNGTQNIFYSDPRIFYISIHQFPHYPGTGSQFERGKKDGYGYILNFPMPPGAGDLDYLNIFRNKIFQQVNEFDPEFILVSAGFDAHMNDPLSMINLSFEGFKEMAKILKSLANSNCNGKILSVLEGGYHLNTLKRCVLDHISILLID